MLKILLVVPLDLEFQEVLKIFPLLGTELHTDEFLHTLQSPSQEAEIVAVILGEPGPTPAAQRTERLIALVAPNLIVVTGIAGALSEDLNLGDVVVAEEIDHYLANSKAVPTQTGFGFLTSGRHVRTLYTLLQASRNLRMPHDLFMTHGAKSA
jgi:nucleoside phosphorylase